jgi:hypothetical protein
MNTNRTIILKALTVATLAAISLPASAERNERQGGDARSDNTRRDGFREPHDVFRDHRDIRHFDRHDYAVWRSGGWRHGRHDGRLGWWWVAAGAWYFYPWPVYPYPDPYLPPFIATQPYPPPAAPPPAQFWYFCTSANGYYPYVPSCPDGWKTVPATPPDASPVAPSR